MRGWLLAVLLCSGASSAQGEEALRVAVVVGSNIGLKEEAALDYAEADARRFHELIREAGQVAPGNAFLVTEGGAEAVRSALSRAQRLLAQARPRGRGTLIFYASAHADEESLHLEGTKLPLAELTQVLEDTPATLRVALLDACRTPVRTRAKGGMPRAAEVPVQLEVPAQVEGMVVLRSAGEGEPAQEWSALRGSLFTHHLLAALRGLADGNGDGAVTLAELYAYTWRHTLASSTQGGAGLQHPSFDIRLKGWGEWVLARPARLGAQLVLGEDVEGSLWVTDPQNGLVAEVRKSRGEVLRLAVRPGRYQVVRPEGAFAEAAEVLLGWNAERVLTRAGFLSVPRQHARLRGGAPLVLRPWALSAGYALSSGSVRGLGPEHFAEVGVRRRWSRALVGARLGFTRARREWEDLYLVQTGVQASLSVGFPFPLGPVEVTVGAEGRGTWVSQSFTRVDAEQAGRLFGIEEPRRWGLIPGVGPFASVTYPLAEPLRVGVEGTAGVMRTPRYDGRAELLPSAQWRMALHWAL
ncbi:caspase family protein [Stigmatella hybrida]|uniref:caspase family protein n=1 Tax=Stigmatella hybrida TaxID=394097 RepID=UPI001CDAF132|nr:caspase family protein [Stigmatella hybrida]